MKNAFDIFYTDTVQFFERKSEGSYDDVVTTETALGEIKCDVQPYRGINPKKTALTSAEYGQKVDYQLRIFCHTEPFIKLGVYARVLDNAAYKDKVYRVEMVNAWNSGYEVFLNEVIV